MRFPSLRDLAFGGGRRHRGAPIAMLFITLLLFMTGVVQIICEKERESGLVTEKPKSKNETQGRHFLRKSTNRDASRVRQIEEETEGILAAVLHAAVNQNGDLKEDTHKTRPEQGFAVTPNIQKSASTTESTTNLPTINNATTQRPIGTENNLNRKSEVTISVEAHDNSVIVITKSDEKHSSNSTHWRVTTEESTVANDKMLISLSGDENATTGELENTDLSEYKAPNSAKKTTPLDEKKTTEDPVERQINEVINSMPKLPELVLSDNITHFKFQKNAEERLIDERITQIARQLAEISLRKRYEEQKLRNSLPISIGPAETESSSHATKSLKNADNNTLGPTPAPVRASGAIYVLPQHENLENPIPTLKSTRGRPVSVSTPTTAKYTAENQTSNSSPHFSKILKINKTDGQTKEINKTLKVIGEKLTDTNESVPIIFHLLPPKPQIYARKNKEQGSMPHHPDPNFYTRVHVKKQ